MRFQSPQRSARLAPRQGGHNADPRRTRAGRAAQDPRTPVWGPIFAALAARAFGLSSCADEQAATGEQAPTSGAPDAQTSVTRGETGLARDLLCERVPPPPESRC